MIWAVLVFGCCLIFYGGYLLVNAYWFSRSTSGAASTERPTQPKVSILIPARNESQHIEACVLAALAQTYPPERFEVIVIDDRSEDDTAVKVKQMQAEHPNLHLLQRTGEVRNAYKKAAIQQGIAAATGEIILTTDGDCHMGAEWLATMVNYFAPDVGLVSGPVVLEGTKPFEEFQALEFMGLIAVGAASITAGRPNMCNGANLAYRKSAFESVDGFGGVDDLASGDDEFLMHKIHAAGSRVCFARDEAAVVRTDALPSFSDFRNQRLRWVSKSTAYKRKSITWTLVVSYLAMVLFPLLLVFSCFQPNYLYVLAAAFLFKTLCEFAILFPAARFFDKLHLLKWLLPEQFLHIVYVLWVGIAANFGKYTWKGRKVS